MTFSLLAQRAIIKSAHEAIHDNVLQFFHDPIVENYIEEQHKAAVQIIIKDTLESLEDVEKD